MAAVVVFDDAPRDLSKTGVSYVLCSSLGTGGGVREEALKE